MNAFSLSSRLTISGSFHPHCRFGVPFPGIHHLWGVSLLILFLTIASTISARISETRVGQSTTFSVKGFTAFIAVVLHRVSFLLVFVNVTGLIVSSAFQFSHFLDTCYCNTSVTGRGTDFYIMIHFEGWISTMRTTRILATVLAAISMAS